MAGWSGLQRVTGFSIAERLAADVLLMANALASRQERMAELTGADSVPLAQAFIAACEDELQAPKPGNVHVFAPGHGMEAQDFIDSAHAAAVRSRDAAALASVRAFSARSRRLGRASAQNTNLGIVLLCAPLAQAALDLPGRGFARWSVARVLDGLDARRRGSRLPAPSRAPIRRARRGAAA